MGFLCKPTRLRRWRHGLFWLLLGYVTSCRTSLGCKIAGGASTFCIVPTVTGTRFEIPPIGVLGGGNRPFTIHQASLVRQWSEDVVFFPNRIELTGAERERLIARGGIRIVEGDVAGVSVGDGRLDGVELASGQVIPRSVVFVGPRFVPRGDLLTDLGCEADENGWVVTDPAGSTSVPGAWAAGGNVSDSPAQLITAAAAGSKAAIALNHYLLEQDIVRAVAIAAELQPSETGSNPRGGVS